MLVVKVRLSLEVKVRIKTNVGDRTNRIRNGGKDAGDSEHRGDGSALS